MCVCGVYLEFSFIQASQTYFCFPSLFKIKNIPSTRVFEVMSSKDLSVQIIVYSWSLLCGLAWTLLVVQLCSCYPFHQLYEFHFESGYSDP